MSDKKLKIIHIMTHPQAYEEFADKQKPAIIWDKSDGSWVGIRGYDWSDLLSIEVRKINSFYEHEIWQPDLKADKIYSHEIFPGVIHRLFPAYSKTRWHGIKKQQLICSALMTDYLKSDDCKSYIFHIGQSVTCPINKSILNQYKNSKFVFSFHGEISLPNINLLRLQKNIFAKLNYLSEHFHTKKLFKQVSNVTYQSTRNLRYLKSYFNGTLSKITMGIYFDKYQGYSKCQCREELNLPLDRKILLTVCRLYSLKQIDRIIEVLSTIENDFLYIIVGHGAGEYEDYLQKEASALLKHNKAMFTGYQTGDKLIKYFNSADLFIHVSKSEAGPVSIMEAMACGLPIFCTDTGNAAELLKANNAGLVVGTDKFEDWKEKLIQYFNGTPIKTMETEIVQNKYDWGNVAAGFLEIYKGISDVKY